MVKISILMPSYNYDWCIGESIESILNQTYKDWELIIVDDASKDNSIKVIKKYLFDKRIKLICHKKNKGLAAAYQTGLKKAKGKYVAFLESDDLWSSKSLEKRIKVIEKTKCSLVYNDIKAFGLGGVTQMCKHFCSLRTRRKIPFLKPFIPKQLLKDNILITFSCVLIKKNVLKKLDFNADSELQTALDWWLWFQLYLNQEKIIFIPEKLTKWRIHQKSYNFNNIGANPVYLQKLNHFYNKMYQKVKESNLVINKKRFALNSLINNQNYINNVRKKIIKLEKILKIIPPKIIELFIYTSWISFEMIKVFFDPRTYRKK